MKRSEINAAIRTMEALINEYRISLPPFCHFTPQAWAEKSAEYDEIRDNMLGWDITDYGLGDFDKVGFALITLRNGNTAMADKYAKTYAEKLILLQEGQHSPMHFHWYKSEDIINRAGGVVLIRVYNDDNGELGTSDVLVNSDGRTYYVPAGTQIALHPGQSITLSPHQYHDFNVQAGTGAVLIGEVSMCNDDNTDNRFHQPVGRFPAIEEDEAPYRLLCNEYPVAK